MLCCPQCPVSLSASSNGVVVFWLAPCTTARTSAQRDAVPVYRVRRRGEHKPPVGFSPGASQPCGGTAVECLRNGQSAASQRPRVRKLAAPDAAARQTNSCSLRGVCRRRGEIRWHGLGFQVVTRCLLAVGVGCFGELGLARPGTQSSRTRAKWRSTPFVLGFSIVVTYTEGLEPKNAIRIASVASI